MRAPGRDAVVDVGASIGVFAVLGVLGAVVWDQVVTLPTFVRVANGGEMDQVQLAGLFGIDGWYAVIGLVGGILAGAALLVLRGRRPLLMVPVVALCGGLAAWLMVVVGLHLGPGDAQAALQSAARGARVPTQLKLQGHSVEFAWPFGALLGALVILLSVTPRQARPHAGMVPQIDGTPTAGDHDVRAERADAPD